MFKKQRHGLAFKLSIQWSVDNNTNIQCRITSLYPTMFLVSLSLGLINMFFICFGGKIALDQRQTIGDDVQFTSCYITSSWQDVVSTIQYLFEFKVYSVLVQFET